MIYNNNAINNETLVALYCRISGDDGSQDESVSINNQKQILERFANENNFTNYKFYVDERKTGTNFNRPAWLEVEQGIIEGRIKTVIVKDSSHLGRNYVKIGQIFQDFFPNYGVRFISVAENLDTLNGEDEFMPFRSFFNEFHSKETSRKLRIAHHNKAINGGRIGGRAPYGYIKDENNKLIIDKEIEDVIKFIFDSALDNKSPSEIAKALTDKKLLTPSALFHERTGITLSTYRPEYARVWTQQSVCEILKNEVYIGDVINFKTTTLDFKNKKRLSTHQKNKLE